MSTKVPLSILLVEDDQFYASVINDYLINNGFPSVRQARNGIECLKEIYEGKTPDVVILDQQLDQLNGLDLLRRIIAFSPDIKVFFLSGQNQVDTAIKALKYGALDYYIKDENVFEQLMPALLQVNREKENLASQNWFIKLAGKMKSAS